MWLPIGQLPISLILLVNLSITWFITLLTLMWWFFFILTGYFREVHPDSQWLVWPYWSLGTHVPLDAWSVTDYILAFTCDLLTCIAVQLYHIANCDWCLSGYVKWMTFRWLLLWGASGAQRIHVHWLESDSGMWAASLFVTRIWNPQTWQFTPNVILSGKHLELR